MLSLHDHTTGGMGAATDGERCGLLDFAPRANSSHCGDSGNAHLLLRPPGGSEGNTGVSVRI